MIGQDLGNYRILNQIGHGGFATVYEAVHQTLGHHVAIKVLHRRFDERDDFAARFMDEARILAHLDHPYIVRCFDFFDTATTSALVVELVEGCTLEAIFEAPPPWWSLEVGLPLFLQVLDALHYAHTRPTPVVHRDIKAGNIFVKRREDQSLEARVMDFGIAKILSSERRHTRSDVVIGTPWYMAPEQILTMPIDPRTDVYALGVLLFQMVTGRLPFVAQNDFILLQLHVNAPPPAPREFNPSVSPALEAIILCALAKSPDARFQSAAAFRDALASTLAEEGPPSHTPAYILPRDSTSPADASTRPADSYEEAHALTDDTRVASAGALAPHIAEATPPSTTRPAIPTEAPAIVPAEPAALPGAPTEATPDLSPEPELSAEVALQQIEANTKGPPPPSTSRLPVLVAVVAALLGLAVAVALGAVGLMPDDAPRPGPTLPAAPATLSGAQPPAPALPDGFVLIQPGTFEMGSPISEPGRRPDETPHTVTITRPFLIATTELTRDEWTSIVGQDPSTFDTCEGRCPVDSITWFDAVSFANARSRAEKLTLCYELDGCTGSIGTDLTCREVRFAGLDCEGYRLPTEAEWEYAARAGTTNAFFNGPILHPQKDPLDPRLDEIGWYGGNARGRIHPVAEKAANPWGLYDVSGNLWEWVHDAFGSWSETPVTDPTGPDEPSARIRSLRGGSSYASAKACRHADRGRFAPTYRNYGVGVRLARTWKTAPEGTSP